MSDNIYNDIGEQQWEGLVLDTAGDSDEAEERTVDIYEFSDNHEERKAGAQSAVQQQPGRPFSRVVTVCLVLLCVLPLAGIIGIKLHCRFKLQSHSRSWTEKTNQTLVEFNHFCKDGCRSFNGSFYYISSERGSWEESRQDCKDRGADLIIVTNKEEQLFINSFGRKFWIGLTDREQEGEWRWVDGSGLNSTGFWKVGYPSGSFWGPKTKCVNTFWYRELNSWKDDDCDTWKPWICEKPMHI